MRHGFLVCPTGIKILGVKFYHKDSAKLNWEEKIERVKKKLNIWKCRKLSITGKGLVVKIDLLSSLIYLALIFPIPTKSKLILTRLVFSFIWGGKYEPVKREQMYLEVEEGGREVVCIPLKLEVLYVCFLCKILIDNVQHKATYFVKLWAALPLRKIVPLDNRGPKAESRPWQYEKLILFLRAHPGCVKEELLKNHKQLYQDLKGKMVVTQKAELRKKKVKWKCIQHKDLSNERKDLNWLAALNRLPVRERLYNQGSTCIRSCPRGCPWVETLQHVFWECYLAHCFWKRTQQLLRLVVIDIVLNPDLIIRGEGLIQFKKGKIIWCISIGKEILWEERNAQVKKKKKVEHQNSCGMK